MKLIIFGVINQFSKKVTSLKVKDITSEKRNYIRSQFENN